MPGVPDEGERLWAIAPPSGGMRVLGVFAVASLFVIRGNDQGTRFELDGPTIGLGRESSNRIQLHDTEVSRQHAEIRRSENGLTLIDLNSSNGTFVNGRRVQRHRLSSGDQIQVGSTLMLYTGPGEEPEEDWQRR